MKKLIALLLCFALLVMGAACDSNSPEETKESFDYDAAIESYQNAANNILDNYTSIPNGAAPADNDAELSSNRVFVSDYGKIHKNPNCSGMKYYKVMNYSEAIASGYVRCQNCY